MIQNNVQAQSNQQAVTVNNDMRQQMVDMRQQQVNVFQGLDPSIIGEFKLEYERLKEGAIAEIAQRDDKIKAIHEELERQHLLM